MSNDQGVCRCVLCHDYGDEIEPITERTIEQIREHGWQVIMIPPDDNGPGWSFTIGLWHNHRSPELAMFGLDVHVMHALLNDLAQQSVNGRPVADRQERHDVINDYPVALRTVDDGWYKAFFGTAIRFYRRSPFPVLQVVWPSKQGQFPWDPDADDAYRDLQPQLWLNAADHPTGAWTQDL
jgi:Domain of unknown function (DUF4262)